MVRIVLILALGLAVTQTRAALAADYGLPPQPPAIAANPFVGGYVALGGSYGVSSARSYRRPPLIRSAPTVSFTSWGLAAPELG